MGLSISKSRRKKAYPLTAPADTHGYGAISQPPHPGWYQPRPVWGPGFYPPMGFPFTGGNGPGAVQMYPPYQPPLQPIAAPYPIHAGSQMPVIPPQLSERYTEHSAPFSASSGFASNRNHEPVRPFQRGRATPGPPRTAGLPAFTSSSNPLRPTSASESDDSDSDLDVNPMLRPVPTSSRGAFRPTYSGHRTPLRNPLPSLPRNVYDSSPYKGLLTFPKTTELLNSTYGSATLDPSQAPNHTEKEGKKSKKGLFRSFSASRKKDKPDRPSITVVPVVVPQPQAMAPPTAMPVPEPAPPLTPGGNPPSVKFDHKGPLSGFMNHSPHRVMYQNETYPSALHLYEALKFIGHRPDLAEKIRKCGRVHDVYPLSASLQDHVRPDWGQVYLKMMEEILHLKFKQHPDLRSLLMNTGTALIAYAEASDSFWGEGSMGQGANELGKAMVRIRDRLRDEGYGL